MIRAKPTHIYAFRDPRTQEFKYIGSSVDPEARMKQHLSFPTNRGMRKWLSELDDVSMVPELVIIDTVPAGQDVYAVERGHIARLRTDHALTNVAYPGGKPPINTSGMVEIYLASDLRRGLDMVSDQTGVNIKDYIRGAVHRALVAEYGHDWLAKATDTAPPAAAPAPATGAERGE